jgi:hypothetical protein
MGRVERLVAWYPVIGRGEYLRTTAAGQMFAPCIGVTGASSAAGAVAARPERVP